MKNEENSERKRERNDCKNVTEKQEVESEGRKENWQRGTIVKFKFEFKEFEKLQKQITEMLKEDLKKAGLKVNAGKFLEKTIILAVFSSLTAFFLAVLLAESLLLGILALACGFAVCFAGMIFKVKVKKRKIAELVEKELPFALMSMSVELNLNTSFEKVLENAAREDYGLLSKEFEKVLEEVRQNDSSIQEALFHFSERIDSRIVKRSIAQLIAVYEKGGKQGNAGFALKKLAEEQLLKQQASAREFSGKLVVFSLLFIAVSAIIPALFQSFIVVGSLFLELDFTALQVLLITIIGFPAIDLAVLVFIRAKTPLFLR